VCVCVYERECRSFIINRFVNGHSYDGLGDGRVVLNIAYLKEVMGRNNITIYRT
jgi:hypothetical protein